MPQVAEISKENWKTMAEAYHMKVCPEFETDYEGRYLALELGGEVGELQNVIKKMWRGNHPNPSRLLFEDLPEELADVYILVYLLGRFAGLDLDQIAADKVKVLWQRIEDDDRSRAAG